MKKHLLVFCIALLSIMTGFRASAQTFDWACFPTSGVILADNNVIANLNLTAGNCSVAAGWVLQCQGAGEQRILSSALGGNPYIRMQKVGGPGATFNFARILTASGALFTLRSISVTPTSVGAAAGGNQVITLHAYKGGREQGSTSTASLSSIALVNVPESQLGAFVNIDEVRFTSDKPAAFGVGIDDVVITTGAVIPTVTTSDPAGITANSATLAGNVTADGGATVTEKGVVYATTANPTIANTKITNGAGTGAISVNAPGLAGSTTYHVRAYATNSIGTAYGADKTFITLAPNQAPVLTGTAGTTLFSGPDALIDPGITVTDDGNIVASGTVSIIGGFHSPEDELALMRDVSMGDIVGYYDGGTGILLLQSPSGTATIAQWQATLRRIVYRNGQPSPTVNTRTISFLVSDGSLNSNTITKTVSIAPPVAVADTYSFSTGTALTIAAPGVLANDTSPDGSPLTAVLVTGPANGTLVLNPNGSFTYTSTGTANDQFTYKVNNGYIDGNTVAVTLTHVNAAPVVTGTAGTTVFSGEDAVIDPGITVSDDSGTLASGTVSITGGLHSAEDLLVFIPNGNTGDITGSYNRLVGVLSLQSTSGVATVAQWRAALRATVYRNGQGNPTTNNRTVTFFVNDGSLNSNTITKTVSIALPVAVADNYGFGTGRTLTIPAPGVLSNDMNVGANPLNAVLVTGPANGTLVLNPNGSFSYTPTGTANDQFTYKVNNGNLDGNTVAVTLIRGNSSPVAVNDTYTVTTNTPFSGNVLTNDTDPDGDQLVISANSSPAHGTLVLNPNGSFTYTPNSTIGDDTFNYQVCDNGIPSLCASGTVVFHVLAPGNTAPVLTASAGATVFSGPDAFIDPGITVTDDGSTLASGVVSISGGFHSPEDQLALISDASTGDIVGFYNGGSGFLALGTPSGTATVAQWQAALRRIVYRNAQGAPTVNNRTISFLVSDGHSNSKTVTKTVSIVLPSISVGGTLPALNTTYGTASASGTFNVSGTNLTAGILVTAPAGFEVSIDNVTFTHTVTIGSGGNIASTPVQVRLAAGNNAGTYSGFVALSSAGAGGINVPTVASTVSPKGLTITAKNITKTYGQTLTGGATTTEFTAAGLVGTETVGNVTLAYGTGAAANATANTYTGTVTASATNGGTFNPANYTINYIAGNIVVNKAALTITANNKGKAFGSAITGGAGSADFTSTGLANTETIGSVTITYGAGAAANAAVGSYPGSIVPSAATGGTFNAANYNITYTAGTLSVGQAILTITANSTSKTYGAVVPTLTVSYSGFVGTDDPSTLTTLPTISTTAVTNSPVNTYPITVNGAVSSNYTIVYQPGTLTVTPAPLTVTANNATKPYGATVPLLGVNYSGFVGADNAASLTTAPTLTTPAVTNSPVGTYPITPSGAVSSNYTFIYKPGTLTVTPAALTITASDDTKTYGSANPALAVTYAGFVGADNAASLTVAPTINTTAVNGSPVGTYPITASGAVSANYTITYKPGILNVTKAALTITANNKGKAFGTALTGGTGSVDFTPNGLVNAETIGSVTITYGAGAAANAVAGTYPGSIVPSAATGGTFNAANYAITYKAGTLTVGQAILTITVNNATKVYGAAIPALSVSYSGFTGGDDASSLTVQPTISTAATANSPVGTYAINASGAVSSNYTIVYQPGTLSVTPAPLTVTASNQNKVYGQNLTGGTGSTAFTSTGLVGTETIGSVTITYGTGAAAGAPVSTYTGAIVPGSATGGTFNAANYNITYAAGNITVGKAPITVTANVQNKLYGDVDPALTYAVTTGALVGTDAFTGTLTRAPGENAGTYAILRSTLALNNNYTLTYAGANLTINKAAVTVTADPQTKPYGSVDPALTFKITNGGLKFADTFTGALTRVAGENAGIYAIQRGTLAISSNYTLTYAGANLTINKADITVTADVQSKAFGAADPLLTFKITSGTLKFADTFTGALTRVAGENTGTYPIQQGTLALSSNYNLTYVGANLSIGKTTITVTADVQTKTYGDVDPVLTYKITSGVLTPGDKFTGTLTRVAGENAGTYAIQQGSLTLGSNYTLNYVGANLTIGKAAVTVTADARTKAYGDADPALTFKITSGALKFADTFTGALTRAPGENAGTYAIQQGTLALSSNYTLTYAGANLTIGKAAITVTADAQNKAFGAADPVLTFKITSGALKFADTFTGALTRVAGENAGAYAIQQGTLALSSNYTLTYVGANLTIGKTAITVTADAQTKAYGDADPALTYKITNGALVGTDKLTGALTRAAGENAGTYAIQQGTLALSSNYSLTYVGANLTIGKAAITVTADPQTKAYGTADPALTYKISSGALKFADTFTGALTRAAGENVGTYAIQQGTLGLSSNYNLTYVGANLSIGKTAITVTADVQTKVYGDADPVLTYKITSGVLGGGDKFTGTLTRVAGENVGTYAIQQGTLALGGNYTLTYVGANLTISKAAITVTADAQTKAYGGADPALTYKISNGALKFADTFTGALTRATGENVGTYAIQQGTLALSSNYTLTYVGANLTIGKALITVTANARNKVYGAPDPVLAYAVTTGALVGTDKFTGALTRVAGENVGAYAIQQGSLALNGNYTLTYIGANLTIGKAPITVTANIQNKVYGAADPALTYTVTTGGLAGTDKFTGALTRVAGENVGTYAIQQGTLALSSNYTLTYAGANLTIAQRTLTITANNASKTYGSANPVLAVSYNGFVNGDNSNTLTTKPVIATTATQASAAGTYPITVSGAAIANYQITYAAGTLTVNKATLTVTAEDKSRLYGVANPPFTVVYSGFVNGDTEVALTKAPVLSTIANSTSLPGLYPITASGATAANYTFNYVQGKLRVIALSNAKLINLVPTSGTVTPSFNSDNFSYRAEVDNDVIGVRLTLTFDPTATATINGSSAPNGRASFFVPVYIGNNTITIVVTAQDHITQNTYTLVVYRGEDQKNIVASNILTPNGDGKNDTWVITDIQLYPNNTVTVFDKGGRTVYTKHGYTNDWNGTFGGAPLTEGTYYYVIDLGPQKRQFKGFITIVHDR
jgi:gliding motility-associated-like protein